MEKAIVSIILCILLSASAAGCLGGEEEPVDTDGDGVNDDEDAFPNNRNETIDTDGDGVGDNSDDFPNDANETVDTDGDGTGDNEDAFPNDPDEWLDSDSDGVGNNEDDYPFDPDRTDYNPPDTNETEEPYTPDPGPYYLWSPVALEDGDAKYGNTDGSSSTIIEIDVYVPNMVELYFNLSCRDPNPRTDYDLEVKNPHGEKAGTFGPDATESAYYIAKPDTYLLNGTYEVEIIFKTATLGTTWELDVLALEEVFG